MVFGPLVKVVALFSLISFATRAMEGPKQLNKQSVDTLTNIALRTCSKYIDCFESDADDEVIVHLDGDDWLDE